MKFDDLHDGLLGTGIAIPLSGANNHKAVSVTTVVDWRGWRVIGAARTLAS